MRLSVPNYTDYTDSRPDRPGAGFQREIARHRHWYLAEGLLFVAVGGLALASPAATTLAAEIVAGAALLLGGLARLFSAGRFSAGRGWRVFSGAVFLAAGSAMLWSPAVGIASLILVVGALLLAEAVVEIFLALNHRPGQRWGFLLISGIASLVLGAMVFTVPGTGPVFIAISIGLSMMLYGVALTALAWEARTARG
jgi:uncharacterized membrane protein HdeD (DUF308 family)